MVLLFIVLMGAAGESVPVNVDQPAPVAAPRPVDTVDPYLRDARAAAERERAELVEQLRRERRWQRFEDVAGKVSETLKDATDPCYLTGAEWADMLDFDRFRVTVEAGEVKPTLWEHFKRWRQWRRISQNPGWSDRCDN